MVHSVWVMILSHTGMYHIIFRGLNRQKVFKEETDFKKMIDIIKKLKDDKGFEIYGYCLLNNHMHLFIKEKIQGDIKKIMHTLLTSYAGWYNRKYQRSRSLIGNRYKSEAIEDEKYVFLLTRYIYQNPKVAGIVKEISAYIWSNYKETIFVPRSYAISSYNSLTKYNGYSNKPF